MNIKEKINLTNWELVSVNPIDKIWNSRDMFCYWANGIQTIIGFSLITALFLTYDLNLTVLFSGIFISLFLVITFSNLIGKPSQKYGVPFPVIARISLGVSGSKYLSLLRGLVGIFMFGVQTFFISKSIGYLIRIIIFSYDEQIMNNDFFLLFFMGQNIIDWSSFILTLFLQYLLFSNGHIFNKIFINFSAYFVYFGLIIFALILFVENSDYILVNFKSSLNFESSLDKKSLVQIFSVAGTIFAYFSILILNYGDFSRYIKNEKEMKLGNYSLFLNIIIFTILAIVIVLGSNAVLTKNMINVEKLLTNPTDIIGKIDNIFLSIVVLFFIFFASSSTNLIANYIPAQNSLINFYPKNLNLKSVSLIILLFGAIVGSFWLPLISKAGFLSLIDTVGTFFGPMFGVIIIDYYLIKKQKIVNKYLFSSKPEDSYFYSKGWHIKALYSILIGFIFGASTIWNPTLMYLQSFSWIIGAILASMTYYFLASD